MNEFDIPHFYKVQPGDVLYHYTSTAGAESIIRSNTFWLSEFSKMNDKSEYVYAKENFVAAYQAREVWIEEIPRFIVSMNLLAHEPATVMMIGSLVQLKDDLVLWDRYADHARGCVIGIDAYWLATRAGVALRRVSYNAYDLRKFVNVGLTMLQEHFETDPDNLQALSELASFLVMDLYAFKHPCFRSEQEVRISRLIVADDASEFGLVDVGGHCSDESKVEPLTIKRRDGPYGSTHFIELPLSDETTRTAIRSIGFGPKFDINKTNCFDSAVPEGATVEFWASNIPLR